MRDTIEWSYALLNADEQALFRRVSVFAGGVPYEAINQVVSSARPLAMDLDMGLSSLVDKSLLNEQVRDDQLRRFSILETIREFALEKLSEDGEGDKSRSAHAAWALSFVETWSREDPDDFLGLSDYKPLVAEVQNILEAFDHFATHVDSESCARLYVGLFNYLYIRGSFREAWSLGQSVLELSIVEPISERLQGRVLGALAEFATMLGNASEGERLGREGLALLQRSTENRDLLPVALVDLSITIRAQRRYAEAMELAELAHRIATESGHPSIASFVLFHIGKLAYLQGDLDRALVCLSEALTQSRSRTPNETTLYSARYLAAVHLRRGSFREAALALGGLDRFLAEIGSGPEGFLLDIVAVLAANTQPVDAVRIFGAVAAYSDRTGRMAEDEPIVADAKAALRAQLGESEYQADYNAGRKLGLDETLELIRKILDLTMTGESDTAGHAI